MNFFPPSPLCRYFLPNSLAVRVLRLAFCVLLAHAAARAQTPGDLDTSFSPGTGADSRVLGLARQADGKLVVVGQFNTFNGLPRNRLTRLNADGSTDPGFNPGSGADSTINAVAVAPDGKILVGGDFYTFAGESRPRLARLTADGSLDPAFATGLGVDGTVQAVAVQPDGKVLLAGGFTAVDGVPRARIARLNADGSVDAGFNPGSGANATVLTLALQADGKILLGGYFSAVNGAPRHRVARLNLDGTLDTSFVPATLDNGFINHVSLTSDGRVLVAGNLYIGLNNRLLRLNADGSRDAGFNPGNNVINSDVSVAVAQSDGKVLIGGYFTSINGVARNGVARMNADGSLDPAFDPGAGANQLVWTMLLQPDGRLVAGGAFTTYGGVSRNRLTRIHNDGATANQPPWMAAIGSLIILEDSGSQTVTVTGLAPGPASEAAQSVTNVTAFSSNPALIPHPTVTYTPGATTATLTFAPAADAHGLVTITVVAQDNGGTAGGGVDRATNTFTVTVTPVNDAPLLVSQARPATVALFNDTNFVYASELPNGGALLTNLGVSVVSFTNFADAVGTWPVIVVPSMHTALVPTLNAATLASISNFVHTGGVLVVMGNHVPFVQVADLLNAAFGYSLVPYRLLAPSVRAAGAAGTPFADDPPWIWANDQQSYGFASLPPNARVMYQRDGVGWDESSVTVFSVGTGRAVTLGGQFSQTSIWSGEGTWLPVLASAITPVQLVLAVSEDAGPQSIAGFASASRSGPTNESAQLVSFLVANDNPALFSSPPALAANGTLSFTPAPNANGAATLTVRAQDDGGTANGGVDTSAPQTFTLIVTPVNDAPAITMTTNLVAVAENSGAYSATVFAATSVGPADEAAAPQTVTNVTILSVTNPALFATGPTLALNGTLAFTPAANASGSALVTFAAQDNGGTANGGVDRATNSFTITVLPLNDAPSFMLAPSGREGVVVAWGKNNSGQTTVPGAPLRAVGLSANADHTLALKADGTVVAWGRNDFGQTTVPGGLNSVVAVAAGGDHSLALKSDGTVVAWGRNQLGQTDVPAGLNRVVALSAGVYHNLALRNDGTVVAWGANNVGQATVPPGVTGVVAVEAGHEFSLALLNDGTVVAWGENTYHETAVPAGLGNVVAIAAGGQHALALKSDGAVVAWGRNTFGSGNAGTGLGEVPAGLAGVVAIAANGEHNLALKSDGTVVAWGRNEEGQTDVPVGLSGAVAVGAGYYHSVALADATGGPQVTMLEDAGSQTVAGMARNISAGLAESASQSVSFTVTNDNNALFLTQPAIAASGTLAFTAAPNANGSATVTVIAVDNGGAPGVSNSAPRTFTITVTPVNDAPSFNLGGTNVTVFPGDGGVVARANWATNISAGPADESGQAVTFTATNSNPAFFVDQPVLLANGTLVFTPEPAATGVVTVGVRATDNGGTDNGGVNASGWQTFTITLAPVKVFVSGAPTVIAGSTVEVPVSLAGVGTEGGVSFTLTYDRPRLVFQSVAVEPGSGLTLTWTEPYGGLMNNVGIIVTKPAGTAFPAGTNGMVRLTFQAPAGTAPTNTPVSFSSAVVLQQVSDATASVIPNVLYVGGSVGILPVPPLEGDVAPRTGGSGAVTVSDAVQLTRFVAGWDTITDFTANGEFQRADSAPRGTLGDGRVTLIDLVQTLRYAAGLDPVTAAGGPTAQAAALPAGSARLAAGTRVVRVVGGSLAAGRANTVSVQLDAQGNEAGVSLSVGFDPAAMTFVNASAGSGASGGSLMVNDAKAAAGRVGLVLVMPAGTGIAAGTRDLISLTFNVANVTGGTAVLVSGDSPVAREVADVGANVLGASFVGGSFNLVLPPGLKAAGLERAADGSLRLVVVNRDGSPATAAQAAKYEVHVTGDLGGAWVRLPDALVIEQGALKIVDPAAGGAGLRLYKLVERP